ncbi:MAG: LamG-like jellyroll fold domain-containing protein, partial [Chloroflexota bacterium]
TLVMHFDGTNGQVLIPNGDAGVTGAATIEGWVNASASSNTEHYFGWRNYTSADFYIDRLSSDMLEARLTTSTGRAYTLSNVPAPQTGWHDLALTYDGASRLTLYVDGVARASIPASGHLLDDGRQANMIGGGQGGNFLPGSVAAVAIYNAALSAIQIASHFHAAATPRTAPPSTPSPATPAIVRAPATSSTSPNPGSLPGHWLGVMANGYPGSSAQPLTDFITATGLRPAVVESFQNWTDASGFYSSQLDMTRGFGALPLVTWGPNDTLAHIIDGSHDAYVRQWALQAKDYGHPFMLRFAHEMNGDWYPWGFAYGHNGNTPQQFIQAWRHVHNIFSQAGADNVIWVWSPNARWGPSDSFASFYPGDSYVDWIAFDTYNWGNTGNTTWTSFSNTYKPSYDEITRLTNKPLMIAEGAAADAPDAPYATAKADWIRQGFLSDVPNVMPRLRGFVWFNADKERDWRVNSSASALAAFRAVAQSAFWR